MSKILDNLYLSGQDKAKSNKFIKENGITHILNVAWESKYTVPDGIKFEHLKFKDQKEFPIADHLEKAVDYVHKVLEEEKGTLLVHCMWGVSRSATVVIGYLIKYEKMTCWKAKDFVQNRRNIVSPNDGFWKTLQDFFFKYNPDYLEKNNPQPLKTSKKITTNTATSRVVSSGAFKVYDGDKPNQPNNVNYGKPLWK